MNVTRSIFWVAMVTVYKHRRDFEREIDVLADVPFLVGALWSSPSMACSFVDHEHIQQT